MWSTSAFTRRVLGILTVRQRTLQDILLPPPHFRHWKIHVAFSPRKMLSKMEKKCLYSEWIKRWTQREKCRAAWIRTKGTESPKKRFSGQNEISSKPSKEEHFPACLCKKTKKNSDAWFRIISHRISAETVTFACDNYPILFFCFPLEHKIQRLTNRLQTTQHFKINTIH